MWGWLILWIPYFLLASGDCTSWPWGSYNYFFYFNICIFQGHRSLSLFPLVSCIPWADEAGECSMKNTSLQIWSVLLLAFLFLFSPVSRFVWPPRVWPVWWSDDMTDGLVSLLMSLCHRTAPIWPGQHCRFGLVAVWPIYTVCQIKGEIKLLNVFMPCFHLV